MLSYVLKLKGLHQICACISCCMQASLYRRRPNPLVYTFETYSHLPTWIDFGSCCISPKVFFASPQPVFESFIHDNKRQLERQTHIHFFIAPALPASFFCRPYIVSYWCVFASIAYKLDYYQTTFISISLTKKGTLQQSQYGLRSVSFFFVVKLTSAIRGFIWFSACIHLHLHTSPI
jgi:hypothetical protein